MQFQELGDCACGSFAGCFQTLRCPNVAHIVGLNWPQTQDSSAGDQLDFVADGHTLLEKSCADRMGGGMPGRQAQACINRRSAWTVAALAQVELDRVRRSSLA